MTDFKDHVLYVLMACAVIGCATALTVTGHLTGEAAVGLLGAAIPSGIGLGKVLTGNNADQNAQTPTGGNGPL